MGDGDVEATIRAIDQQIVTLLNQRAQLESATRATSADPYNPADEALAVEQATAENPGPLSNDAIREIFREVLSATRAVDRPLRIGYLGPRGTFSFEAASRHFGHQAEYVPCRTIPDIYVETQRRTVDYGVVPIENSTEGAVTNSLDRLMETDLLICAAIEQPVSHFLLSHGKLATVARVYSHPQALAQCRRWLAENLPRATTVETSSTAAAAQQAIEPDSAAISTLSAAELYGVPVIARNIEDVASNVTRFFVVGPHMSGPTGRDRTAIVFTVEDRAGALFVALKGLAERGINLTRIESRPSRRRLWEYVFFVELDGHPEDDQLVSALAGMRESSTVVRILGAWPVAERRSAG